MNNHEHAGHGDGPSAKRCMMNMLFNWQTENLCIVFRWWRVDSLLTLALSCLIVAAFTASYEALRETARQYDERILEGERYRRRDRSSIEDDTPIGGSTLGDDVPLLGFSTIRLSKRQQLVRATLYALQVLLSMLIMLIFMTYNGFLMISVVFGAGIGYYVFGKHTLSADSSPTKNAACH